MKTILASASPRRKELLTLAGVEFNIIPSKADEIIPSGLSPVETVIHLASIKAEDVYKKNTDSIIIGADTIVVYDNKILGKPKSKKDAFNMLTTLSGNTHSVFTGVCIIKNGNKNCFCEETKVTFYPLTDDEIDEYIATNEPMDKAGAYGIQGKGSLLVKSINGDYFNVVGLPISKLMRELKSI